MLIEAAIKVGSNSCIQTFVIAFDDVDGPDHGQENKVIFLLQHGHSVDSLLISNRFKRLSPINQATLNIFHLSKLSP